MQKNSPAPSISPSYCLSDFDFDLPDALIAQHPAAERRNARLLDGRQVPPVDRVFHELPQLLRQGDLLVFNDTKVIRARLFGHKSSGGKVELLVERVLQGQEVIAHMKTSKKPAIGSTLQMHRFEHNPNHNPALTAAQGTEKNTDDDGFEATLLGRWPDQNGALFRFALHNKKGDTPFALMEQYGHIPLPPYIRHSDSADDAQRYQTVFARHPGAVAAPTAALHFDTALLAELNAAGIAHTHVTLHVGAGTFQPVKVANLAEHKMHSEWFNISTAAQQAIAHTRARGGRIVAVGTTTVRTLESWAQSGMTTGDTQIFITPGFKFSLVDVLITNFHLPKSTLMMLVSAFAGYAPIKSLYQHAIKQQYRFFSYGDAMLLERNGAANAG